MKEETKEIIDNIFKKVENLLLDNKTYSMPSLEKPRTKPIPYNIIQHFWERFGHEMGLIFKELIHVDISGVIETE